MSRELNRDIFGDISTMVQARTQRPTAEALPTVSPEDLKIMGYQLDSIQKKMKEYESKLEVLASRWDEVSASSRLRFERIQSHFQRQGEAIQANFKDVHSKVATIAGKVSERKVNEASISEMIERHQAVVQTFDARLQQMQKVISEQELQLMSSRSELKEALKELAKLKRF